MAALLVVAITTSFYYLHGTVDCSILPQRADEAEFQPLCSRKCNDAAPNESSNNMTFPEYRCSCSQSCTIFEDCCYDSPYKNRTMGQQFDIACMSVVGRDRYRAVSSCPTNKRSDFCKQAMGRFPPVTSRVTNITYGNTFCAYCNGERENLITWNVELRCPSENEDKTEALRNDSTRIIYSLREFWKINEKKNSKRLCKFHVHYQDFSILDGLELRSCNSVPKISTCSASWRDLSVMEKCRSYEDPVYFHNTAYRNSDCAQCNYLSVDYSSCLPFHVKNLLQMKLIDSSILDYCKKVGSEACVRYLYETGKGSRYSLSKILNINAEECVPPEGKRCCAGKRYDFRTKMCRKINRG